MDRRIWDAIAAEAVGAEVIERSRRLSKSVRDALVGNAPEGDRRRRRQAGRARQQDGGRSAGAENRGHAAAVAENSGVQTPAQLGEGRLCRDRVSHRRRLPASPCSAAGSVPFLIGLPLRLRARLCSPVSSAGKRHCSCIGASNTTIFALLLGLLYQQHDRRSRERLKPAAQDRVLHQVPGRWSSWSASLLFMEVLSGRRARHRSRQLLVVSAVPVCVLLGSRRQVAPWTTNSPRCRRPRRRSVGVSAAIAACGAIEGRQEEALPRHLAGFRSSRSPRLTATPWIAKSTGMGRSGRRRLARRDARHQRLGGRGRGAATATPP